jgi:hypothetical protein
MSFAQHKPGENRTQSVADDRIFRPDDKPAEKSGTRNQADPYPVTWKRKLL